MKIRCEEDLHRVAQSVDSPLAPSLPRIAVGVSSCGIAAGAGTVMESIKRETGRQGAQCTIAPVGCLGFCGAEPLVEINMPEIGRLVYGHVTAARVPD